MTPRGGRAGSGPGGAGRALLCRVDDRRRTFAELWRSHRLRVGAFRAAAARKLLGVPPRRTFGIRSPERLDLHEPSEVPQVVREPPAVVVGACVGTGLAFRIFAAVDAAVGVPAKA